MKRQNALFPIDELQEVLQQDLDEKEDQQITLQAPFFGRRHRGRRGGFFRRIARRGLRRILRRGVRKLVRRGFRRLFRLRTIGKIVTLPLAKYKLPFKIAKFVAKKYIKCCKKGRCRRKRYCYNTWRFKGRRVTFSRRRRRRRRRSSYRRRYRG